MPRLNTVGSAIQGGANAILSIDGSTPLGLVGYTGGSWGWFTDDIAVGSAQNGPSGDFSLYSYTVSTDTVALLETVGGNYSVAGGSVWGVWLSGPYGGEAAGVRTSVVGLGPFPAAALADASSQGVLALVTTAASNSGLSVYDDTGDRLVSIAAALAPSPVRVRDGVLAYQDMAGWHLVTVETGGAFRGFTARAGITFCCPFAIGSAIWLCEYDGAADQFSLRPAGGGNGWLLPAGVFMYYLDVIGLGSHAFLAWATGAGEAPDELVTLEVNVTNGATILSTVVGGVLVPTTGPTLEAASFPGGQGATNRLPVQSEKALNAKGEIVKSWRDVLQGQSNSIQSIGTQVNNLPRPVAYPGFGSVNGMQAPGPNSPLLITSNDGTITVTENQGAQSVDLSASGGGSGVPYYVPDGETFTIPEYIQGLWTMPITVDGDLVVDGFLVEVD